MLAATQWNGSSRSAKPGAGERVAEHAAQRLDRVQVRAGPGQRDRAAPQVLAEGPAKGVAAPQITQPLRRAGRVGRHERSVDRPHRGADHHVGPDSGLGQRPEHADLVGAEHAAPAEHECRLHRRSPPVSQTGGRRSTQGTRRK